MDSETITVERTIKATPERIFALLADAGKHESFDGSGALRGITAESHPLSLGTTFDMSMHRGLGYRTSNTVVEFDSDRRIAWQTTGFKGLIGGRIWRYELTSTPEGTVVRETWDLSQDRQKFLLRRGAMPVDTEKGMRKTLERIASVVEADRRSWCRLGWSDSRHTAEEHP